MTAVPAEFSSTAEFRSQLVAWLDENDLTPPPGDHSLDAHQAQHLRVLSALYDAGWMRYGWPESAGGLGGPDILRAIVGEEIVGRGLDHPGPYSMLDVLTPTMIDYASPELATEMVPRLLSGRESWCQGFSEPGSGSDLASLKTRAEQRGDDWVINGQKVWTSFAQYATRCVLLTRTGGPDTPNHEAITAFFVDLDTPGITVRPLRTMHDVDEFCEVYFDDVVVPTRADARASPATAGDLAMDLLPYERSTCFWQRIAYLYSRFDAAGSVRSAKIGGLGSSIDSDLGEAYLALHTLRCRSRATPAPAGGRVTSSGPDTSIDKGVAGPDAEQRFTTPHATCCRAPSNSTNTDWRTEVPVLAGGHASTAAPPKCSATSSRVAC
jgi:alkylation response protein AidB-like acyl-CoA dehydrogenase